MEIGVWCVFGMLLLLAVYLAARLFFLHRALREISADMEEKLETDTNTLISISSRDRELRRFAEKLNVQLRALRRERRRLQNGDLELKNAVTSISHDLRTPLTASSGYLELLRREALSEKAKNYVAVISGRMEAMKSLTEELFQYSAVLSGQDQGQRQRLDLRDALAESMAAFYAAFQKREITPVISLPEQPVLRILEPGKLSRVFSNVISNALRYGERDFSVSLTERGEITFQNTAPALSQVQVGHLFDRFYTVESGQGGTGLGLSIAKVLTEELGGSISAAYENGIFRIQVFFPQ